MSPATCLLRRIPLTADVDRRGKYAAGEIIEVTGIDTRELYIRCDGDGSDEGAHRQAEQFYQRLPTMLATVGARMVDVVLERVFFRDLTADLHTVRKARSRAYGAAGVDQASTPLVSDLGQAPCSPQQAFQWQLYAVIPREQSAARVTVVTPQGTSPAARIVQVGGRRHFYATQIRRPGNTFRSQCDSMFTSAAELLGEQGATFQHVVRTWCYLDGIDQTYAEFNRSRNEFFQRAQVIPPPASTGIGAKLSPPAGDCSMDLYALLDREGARVRPVHAAVLNEAMEYGSAFSRGMQVELTDRTVLYISGTASVDETGATAHPDDVRKQIERMLRNVQQLLVTCHASFSDIVHAIGYLKSANDVAVFHDVLNQWGIGDLPMSIVQAEVCRGELRCEMEVIAILPRSAADRSNRE